MEFAIRTFTSNATVYRFKQDLPLVHENYGGLLCLYNKELDIHAFGNSWRECMDDIQEELEFLWENYAMAPDEGMTAGAIELKRKLRSMIVEQPL